MRYIYCLILLVVGNAALGKVNEFVENKGQWASTVRFKADIPGGYLIIKSNSLEYFFYDTKALRDSHGQTFNTDLTIPTRRVLLAFENCELHPNIKPVGKHVATYNYIMGNNPAKWHAGVASYREVVLENLYKDIDLRLFEINGTLKYEYLVRPGGKPEHISLRYDGASKVKVSKDEVLIETDINVFKEFNPYTYQNVGQKQVPVDAHFVKKLHAVAFELGDYDKELTLVIDPELVFSTYSGSSSDNWSHTATYDDQGNLYAGGSVFGPSYLTTEGAFQTTVGGTSTGNSLVTDIVINKYDATNGTLLYATFIGGTQSEVPHSLIVNKRGELVIFGTTSSNNFPVSANAFSPTFNGGTRLNGDPVTSNITFENGTDIFVAVLSNDGKNLVGSTFVGGKGNEGINDTRRLEIRNYGDEFRGEVVTDEKDNIYIASTTNSADFPVTDGSKIANLQDAVIFRLNKDCSALQWSTYLGGSGYDAAFSLKVTPANEVFVTGVTMSNQLATANALKNEMQGSSDGFVAKFVNDKLTAFTYVGTEKADLGLLLDTDTAGNVYVLGLSSGDYPVTQGVYRNQNSGQFIQSLNNSLTKSNFSTVVGSGRGDGKIDIVPTAFLVNACGNMYVAGWGGRVNINTRLNLNSSTLDLPTTRDAFKRTTTGSNFYLMILQADARSLLYGTYFGSEAPPEAAAERGDHLDGGTCRFDKKGVIYHSACVCKAGSFVGFPLKNAVSNSHNSPNCNMAAFKFDIDALIANYSYTDGTAADAPEYCSPVKLTLNNKSRNARTYEWFVDNVLVSRLESPEYTFTKGGVYKVKLKSYNSTTCLGADSTERVIRVKDFPTSVSRDTLLCPGVKYTLNAEGGLTYAWSPSSGLSTTNTKNPVVTATATTTYTVKISNGICSIDKPVVVTVSNEKEDLAVTPSREVCRGDSVTLTVRGNFSRFYWQSGTFIDSVNRQIKVAPTVTTAYDLFTEYTDGCQPQRRTTLSVDNTFEPNIRYEFIYNCNEASQLVFINETQNATGIQWNFGNGVTTNDAQPVGISYRSGGDYVVNVTTRNATGCQLTKDFSISYRPWDGNVPNVISPNGDGKNDLFDIGVDGTAVTLYNRWGKIVYESPDYKNNWGSTAEAGTYLYKLTLPNKTVCKGYLDVYK